MKENFVVKTKNLCKEFSGKPVLKHIDINVKQGEIYGILGANGAGKTTLLKLIGGFLEPSEGYASILEKNTWDDRKQTLSQIGSLLEAPIFYEHLTASENLSIHLAYMNASADIAKTLKQVGLDYTLNKTVSKFSLGMRKRLGIARSIIHKPKVLLLDEPINGLDPIAIKEMRELFISLKNEGMTILLSSHILSETLQTAERLSIISNGNLILEENVSNLISQHKNNLENYLISQMSGGTI